jgi:integrase
MAGKQGRRGHNEGSIYHEASGRWVAALTLYDATGKRRRVRRFGKTRTEARQKLKELQQQAEQGVQLTDSNVTLAQFLKRWLEDSVRPSVRAKTYEGYESIVRVRIVPRLGRQPLNKVTPAMLQRLYTDLAEAGLSARSIHHTHRVLHKAFKQAMRWGLIPRNPVEATDPPRPQQAEMKILTRDEVGTLLRETTDDRLHALYVLAVTSGMRLGELLGLRWTDIEGDAHRLFVRRSLQRTRHGLVFVEPKTAKSRRTVMLTERAVTALRRHRQQQAEERLRLGPVWEDQELVFPNHTGGPQDPGAVSNGFKGMLKRLGLLAIRFHDLRHTAASLLLSAGTHPKIVSEMLGHSTIVLTLDTYSHVVPVLHSEAADTMERLLGES